MLTSSKLLNNSPSKRTELHRFCGTAGPKFVKTTERGTIIRFHASTSGIYKGFNCTAKAVRHAICLDDNKPTGRFLFLYFSSEMFENHKYFKVYRRPYTMMIKFCKRSTRQENIQDFLFQSHSWWRLLPLLIFSQTDNEVWLNTGSSEVFTSPNYPFNYGKQDDRDWVFCVSYDTELCMSYGWERLSTDSRFLHGRSYRKLSRQ